MTFGSVPEEVATTTDEVVDDVRAAARVGKEPAKPEMPPALARLSIRQMIEFGHQIE
jgi:hypothetical protein